MYLVRVRSCRASIAREQPLQIHDDALSRKLFGHCWNLSMEVPKQEVIPVWLSLGELFTSCLPL